jgi:hypothetical protein
MVCLDASLPAQLDHFPLSIDARSVSRSACCVNFQVALAQDWVFFLHHRSIVAQIICFLFQSICLRWWHVRLRWWHVPRLSHVHPVPQMVDLPFIYPMPICSTSPHLALSLGNILHFLGSSFVFSHFVLFLTRFS